jgi:hypothetical protein
MPENGQVCALTFQPTPKFSPKPGMLGFFGILYDPGIETCKFGEKKLKAAEIDIVRLKFSKLTKDMSSMILETKKAGVDIA